MTGPMDKAASKHIKSGTGDYRYLISMYASSDVVAHAYVRTRKSPAKLAQHGADRLVAELEKMDARSSCRFCL